VAQFTRFGRASHSAFDFYDLGSLVIIVLALSVAICVGAHRIAPTAIGVIAAMTASSLAIGRAALRLPITTFRLLAEYLLGFTSASLAILLVCYLGSISAGWAAVPVAAAGVGAAGYCLFRGRVEPARGPVDLLMCCLICLASVVWSWQAIIAMPGLAQTGTFNAWSDYFIHSGEIAQFANFDALHGTSIFAASAPLPLYHYGSYMLAATLSSAGSIPALVAATAFWTPLGFILLGMGACVLGGVLAGQTSGVLAVAMVLLIPDAAHYGLRNPFFDFHWLLQVSSTGSYAVAFACFAVAATAIWLRTRHREPLVWAAASSLAVFEIRVHIFVPLAMLQVAVALFAWRPSRTWHRLAAIALTAGAVLLAVVLSEHVDRTSHLLSGAHRPIQALLLMHGMQPSPYSDLYAQIAGSLWWPAALALGLVMLIVAASGALFPLYLAGLAWRSKAGTLAREDWLPLVATGCYVSIVVAFPQMPLEPLEFAHRPFVFVYALLAIWCANFAASALASRASVTWSLRASVVVAVVLLIVPLKLERLAQRSLLSWGENTSMILIPPGLQEVASFVRAHAARSDVVATTVGPLEEPFFALSERSAFIPGTEFMLIQSGIPTAVADARRRQLDAVLKAENPDAARRAAACAGIDWLVTLQPDPSMQSAWGGTALSTEGARRTSI